MAIIHYSSPQCPLYTGSTLVQIASRLRTSKVSEATPHYHHNQTGLCYCVSSNHLTSNKQGIVTTIRRLSSGHLLPLKLGQHPLALVIFLGLEPLTRLIRDSIQNIIDTQHIATVSALPTMSMLYILVSIKIY